ncbi:hypothetical protein CEXT_35601 [Caerostris extrusa]|uniref:Uncharacterized protein n=1 Tax=Caerostris extrusa TaxID=172846 RepID=A0AAV4P300_CAEEX|nr:hypothetical protein CEXT_35601 [Caerostris extrusa]
MQGLTSRVPERRELRTLSPPPPFLLEQFEANIEDLHSIYSLRDGLYEPRHVSRLVSRTAERWGQVSQTTITTGDPQVGTDPNRRLQGHLSPHLLYGHSLLEGQPEYQIEFQKTVVIFHDALFSVVLH